MKKNIFKHFAVVAIVTSLLFSNLGQIREFSAGSGSMSHAQGLFAITQPYAPDTGTQLIDLSGTSTNTKTQAYGMWLQDGQILVAVKSTHELKFMSIAPEAEDPATPVWVTSNDLTPHSAGKKKALGT